MFDENNKSEESSAIAKNAIKKGNDCEILKKECEKKRRQQRQES